jgi:hypothetical protein
MPTPREAKYESIATAVAVGMETKKICQFYDYTAGGLHQLVTRPHMQRRIREKQAELGNAAVEAARTLTSNLLQSATNIVTIANNTAHKDSYKANERVLQFGGVLEEEKHVQVQHQGQIELTTQKRALDQLNEGLGQIKQLFERSPQITASIEDDPHLMEGPDSVDSVMDAQFSIETGQGDDGA